MRPTYPKCPKKEGAKKKKKGGGRQTADGARTAFLHVIQLSFTSPFFGMLSLEPVCAP